MRNKTSFKEGNIPWNKGKILSSKYKDKISQTKKGVQGHKQTEETKRKISETLKRIGHQPPPPTYRIKHHTTEAKQKISEALRKRMANVTDEYRKKMSEAHKGVKLSEKHRESISKGQMGGRNHQWKGGLSFEPYTIDWTGTLRRSIRERDKYTCQLCGEPQGDKALCVHHIDYDKKNNNPANLISLCLHCHSKTVIKRQYWIDLFKNKQR